MSYFWIIERLNSIESDLRLIHKDLEAANTFIDSVPKGDMVSPQVQELYMLVEYLSGERRQTKSSNGRRDTNDTKERHGYTISRGKINRFGVKTKWSPLKLYLQY